MFAQIRNMPGPKAPERELYDFAHYQDHVAIVRAIKQTPTLNLTLIVHQIYPRPGDMRIFLQRHQDLHDDMNRALKLIRQDLTQLNDDDDNARNEWSWRNWSEHVAAHRSLVLP